MTLPETPAAIPSGQPYDPAAVEGRWTTYWEAAGVFHADPERVLSGERPPFVIPMPPPNVTGRLHMGHALQDTVQDLLVRYHRARGFEALWIPGTDHAGIATQNVVERALRARGIERKAIGRAAFLEHVWAWKAEYGGAILEQKRRLGDSCDWRYERFTMDDGLSRAVQHTFVTLYDEGLIYRGDYLVNWDPDNQTVLSNEEVIDGRSERGSHPVVQLPMRQWMLRITDYADRLLDGLDALDWPASVKEMQRNWIGRSVGAEVDFAVAGHPPVRVFTTRPDTLFGATYLVLAPEHPLVAAVTSPEQAAAVAAYVQATARKTERDRQEDRTKTGVWTGAHAVNPVNGEHIPVWTADYVLAGYGTGAIMAVPAHDARDFEFATSFGLPVREVVVPPGTAERGTAERGTLDADDQHAEAYTGDGPHVRSDASARAVDGVAGVSLDGMHTAEAKAAVLAYLEATGVGRAQTTLRLRDWLFSRQRYWGEPIPMVHPAEGGPPRPLPKSALPVLLPDVESYAPAGTGESPLAGIPEWVQTTDPETGEAVLRETNTMPQWAGSCWYYLRFIDPTNTGAPVDPEKERYWMPVDLYVGGAEHAVLHLLYARFWHKVLFDAGVVSTDEPFRKLVNQGMILGEVEYTAYRHTDTSGADTSGYVSAEHVAESADGSTVDVRDGSTVAAARVPEGDVQKKGDGFVLREHADVRVTSRAHKMSKSRGNVVNPDDVVAEYGADSLRLYEMFMGPLEQVKPWNTRSVDGVHRFLARAYRLLLDRDTGALRDAVSDAEATPDQLRVLHATIRKVTDDVEALRFNTAIAAMMEFVNAATKWDVVPRSAAEPFVLLLAPFAPHLAEELWAALGHDDSLAYAPWPEAEDRYLVQDTVRIAVQVNGKLRGTVEVAADAGRDAVLAAARAEPNVARTLDGATVRKEIVVPGRLVNLVVA